MYVAQDWVQYDQRKKHERAVHVTSVGAGDMHTRFWWGELMESVHLEDLVVDRIVLKWVFKKWDGEAWNRLLWTRIGTGGWFL